MIRSNAEVTAAISYPGLAAFPTRGVQAVCVLLGEPLAKGSHSSAAVTKPDCHLDNLMTWKKKCIVKHKGHKQLSLHILPNIASPGLQLCLHTCSADIMEDAQEQGFGNTASSPYRTIKFIQSPVKILCLLGLYDNTRLVHFHCGHSIVTHTPHSIWPCATVTDHTKDTEQNAWGKSIIKALVDIKYIHQDAEEGGCS